MSALSMEERMLLLEKEVAELKAELDDAEKPAAKPGLRKSKERLSTILTTRKLCGSEGNIENPQGRKKRKRRGRKNERRNELKMFVLDTDQSFDCWSRDSDNADALVCFLETK